MLFCVEPHIFFQKNTTILKLLNTKKWIFFQSLLYCTNFLKTFLASLHLAYSLLLHVLLSICIFGCDENIQKQESPPAWTQEAYRPPRGHSNFLLFREGGGSLDKKFFFQSEHVSSQIWCQKIFPLLGGGGVPQQKFFFQSEHVSSQIWCQKIFPFTETGTPPCPRLNQPIRKSETPPPPPSKAGSAYPKIWDLGPPLP